MRFLKRCRTQLGEQQGAALPSMTGAVVLVSGVSEKAPAVAMELEGENGGYEIWTVSAVAVNRGPNYAGGHRISP